MPGALKREAIARSDQRGITTVDIRKISGPHGMDSAAGALAHEVQHDIDVAKWGIAGNTKNHEVAKSEFEKRESNAYRTQAFAKKVADS